MSVSYASYVITVVKRLSNELLVQSPQLLSVLVVACEWLESSEAT